MGVRVEDLIESGLLRGKFQPRPRDDHAGVDDKGIDGRSALSTDALHRFGVDDPSSELALVITVRGHSGPQVRA